MALSKEQLLSRKTIRRKLVTLAPGEEVWMREFSVNERAGLAEKYKVNDPDPKVADRGALAMLVVALDDEHGNRLVPDDEVDGMVAAIEGGSQATVDALWAGMSELNGLGEGALQEALGKSAPTPTASSSFASPETSTSSTSTP